MSGECDLEKDFEKRRLTHNTLPKVKKKVYDRLHYNANVNFRIKAFHRFHVNKLNCLIAIFSQKMNS